MQTAPLPLLSRRAPRSTCPAASSTIPVILSAAKDLHSEAAGLPGASADRAAAGRLTTP